MRTAGVIVVCLALAACNRTDPQEGLPPYFDPFADVKRTMNEPAATAPSAGASAPSASPAPKDR